MVDLNKELRHAEQLLRSGSIDQSVAILKSLRLHLESPNACPLPDQERLRYLVKVLNNLGIVYKNLGDLDSAAKFLEEAYSISPDLTGDTVRLRTGILSNLGLLYSRQRLYAKSLAAFNEALALTEVYPNSVDVSFIAKLRNNRALFFVRFGELDKARDELGYALETTRDINPGDIESEREAWLIANLAMIHAELGEEEIYDTYRREELNRQARGMFIRSAELYGSAGYIEHKLIQLLNIAEIEIRLDALEEARRRLREAHHDAERLNNGRALCDIARISVELAIKSGDRESVIDRVSELIDTFRKFDLADLPARLTRLENVLRRAGQKEALKLVSDFRDNPRPNHNNPVKKASAG
jgi:tetratricopeptide (TPR) repeat protein